MWYQINITRQSVFNVQFQLNQQIIYVIILFILLL